MVRLFILVESINDVMDEGYSVIRVYTDTSADGDFTTLDGTVTLVADTVSYEYIDSDGTDETWYETAYFDATPGESDKSAARKGETASTYATVKELRAHIGQTVETADWELAQLLDGAARAINRFCNRPDGFFADRVASARVYAGSGKAVQWIDECVAIGTVAVKAAVTSDTYTAWSSGDWIGFSGDPLDPNFNSTPYRGIMVDPTGDESVFAGGKYTTRSGFRPTTTRARGAPTVQVTARWGYADMVPADIKLANVMQATRWYKRLQSSMTDTVASADFGTLMYTKSLDPAIRQILVAGRYKRVAIGRR